MLRYILLFSGILTFIGCTSNSNNLQATNLNNNTDQVTLSHVNAYLLIGNITKAEEKFKTIATPELVQGAMLTLAELRSVKGDFFGAQQAFLYAINNPLSLNLNISPNLLKYLCNQKKWQTLKGYGAGILNSSSNIIAVNNQSLSVIGQCFFKAHQWYKAKYWLNKLDLEHDTITPLDFLALARLSIIDKEYTKAKQLMIRFEATKSKIDAHILWTAVETYQGLQQFQRAELSGQYLNALFPNSDYSKVYKEVARQKTLNTVTTIKNETQQQPKLETKNIIHIIKKGQTLYQLSKIYDVFISDLLRWNPTLEVDNISLGTPIRISN